MRPPSSSMESGATPGRRPGQASYRGELVAASYLLLCNRMNGRAFNPTATAMAFTLRCQVRCCCTHALMMIHVGQFIIGYLRANCTRPQYILERVYSYMIGEEP